MILASSFAVSAGLAAGGDGAVGLGTGIDTVGGMLSQSGAI